MRPTLELDIDKQTLRPGEELSGTLAVSGARRHKGFTLSLQGEEILGANNIIRSFVLPVVDENVTLAEAGELEEGQVFEFDFRLPEQVPPSYASQDLRCQYFLKARLRAGWRDTIQRFHLSVLPPQTVQEVEGDEGPRELVLEEENLRLVASLDRGALPSGESLTGNLVLTRTREDTPAPSRLTFRFAAIEESTEPGYFYRKVLWVQTHDVEPDSDCEFPVGGYFDFPVSEDAPFTGAWNTFKIHYGFRVGMYLPSGKHIRHSLPIRVYRVYSPDRRPLRRTFVRK